MSQFVFALILTLLSLSQVRTADALRCLRKEKPDAFDIANNLLIHKTTSNWLSLNKEAARKLIETEEDCNVKDVFIKFGNLRKTYEDCDEESQKQVEAMIDLMYNQSRLNPTQEKVSKRRLNTLVMESFKALRDTCLNAFEKELPKVDTKHEWIVSEPKQLGLLVYYKTSWNRKGGLFPTYSEPVLTSYKKANYDEIRQLSSDRARKAWMYFFLTFHNNRRPLLDREPRTLKWKVLRNNVAELYEQYVENSCQVFKKEEMANLMSGIERFINRWRVDLGDFVADKDYIIRVMLNSRICKELEKEDKEVLVDRLTATLDSKLRDKIMKHLGIK